MSKYLNGLAWTGFQKLGAAYAPGHANLPPFSAIATRVEVDRILDFLPTQDRKDLQGLLPLFGLMPQPLVCGLVRLIGSQKLSILRLLDVGLKGLVHTLYYSDPNVLRRLKWDAQVTRPRDTSAMHRAREGARRLRQIPPAARLYYIRKLREAILAHESEILDAIQRDTRKSRTDALVSDIFSALDHLRYLEKEGASALKRRKVSTPLSLMVKTSWVEYEPLGTVLIISPWNYPFYQCIVPVTSAFLAGNAVIYKPSEHTPLTGLMEKIFDAAQFDPDWVQVVYGDGKVGAELIASRPDKIFFTGSVKTGKAIMKQASDHLIPVELELGGKDPAIVFADANLERASGGVLWGALTNLGQSCTSVERVYVERPVYDKFKDLLVRRARALKQGVDTDGGRDIGDMTTDFQVQIVHKQLQAAKAAGARFLVGPDAAATRQIPPIVVENAPEDSDLVFEETFGPVIPLVPFDTEEEAITKANHSPYGLSASVWTADLTRARRVASRIVTGNVSINNVMLTEGNPALPFGGVKNSGFGRYKGEEGLRAFSNVKAMILDKNSSKIEANWFPYTPEKFQLFHQLSRALFAGRGVRWLAFVLTGLKLESLAKRLGKLP